MKIVLATGNPNKVLEIRSILSSNMTVLPQTELDIPSPVETGLTFVENAIIKARNAAAFSGLPAIADDSGLLVDFLDGAPGVYSSRYAGDDATDDDNNARLLAALSGVPREKRAAQFYCVMVLLKHERDPSPLIAQGTWRGEILTEPRGTGGFGYDPVFYVPEFGRAVAELTRDEKHRASHRGQALVQLKNLMNA